MTDIVERLRWLAGYFVGEEKKVMGEAAEEIGRLRNIDAWSFDDLVAMAKRILDERYPADIFTGESGDVGPRFVVALRAVIEELAALDEQVAQ